MENIFLMELLGHIYVDESVDKLNGFGREVLPMLQEEYLGKTFLCYKNGDHYLLERSYDAPNCSRYESVLANIISGNSRDVGLDIKGIHIDLKNIAGSLRSFHQSKSLEYVFEEELLKQAG